MPIKWWKWWTGILQGARPEVDVARGPYDNRSSYYPCYLMLWWAYVSFRPWSTSKTKTQIYDGKQTRHGDEYPEYLKSYSLPHQKRIAFCRSSHCKANGTMVKRSSREQQHFSRSHEERTDTDSNNPAGTGRFSFRTPRRLGRTRLSSSTSSSRSQVASSNAHTNMLIQSAARSVLDGTSPNSTPLSEDGSEYASSASSKPVPTLQSLETKPIPAMPDEQDRKRFIVSPLCGSFERSYHEAFILTHVFFFDFARDVLLQS